MNDEDMKNVHVAAADLETVEFERDHAAMELEEAVTTAVEHGEPVEEVAKAANLAPEEVVANLGTDAPAEGSADSSE